MFTMRFTLRSPEGASSAARADQYSTMLEMCSWAESRGAIAAVVCQHHSEAQGYLPSPIPAAAAIAARTSTLLVSVAALLVPLYEPVKLAEDMAVVDLFSRGRVTYVLAVGYREEEMAMFGVTPQGRGLRTERTVGLLRRLWVGETVDVDGREATVRPLPFTPGGPMISMGGGTPVAARRAARLKLPLLAETSDPAVTEAYLAQAAETGEAPGVFQPAADMPTTAFIAEDPDKAWAELGEAMLSDARAYAAWNTQREGTASISRATTVEELRAEGGPFRVLTPEEARAQLTTFGPVNLQPTVGGLDPDVAWRYLESAVEAIGTPRAS